MYICVYMYVYKYVFIYIYRSQIRSDRSNHMNNYGDVVNYDKTT